MKLNIILLNLLLLCSIFLINAQNTIVGQSTEKHIYIDSSIVGIDDFIKDSHIEKGVFHLFAHGRPGELYLNNQWLSEKQIIDFLKPYILDEVGCMKFTHINVYACDFAKGKKGKVAMENLYAFFSGGVSASNNKVGNYALGGDWEMEKRLGSHKNILSFPLWKGQLQVTFSYVSSYTNPSVLTSFNCAGYTTMDATVILGGNPLTVTFPCPLTTVNIPLMSLGDSNVETYQFDAIGVAETLFTACPNVNIIGNTAVNNTGSGGTSGVDFFLTVSSPTPFTQILITKISGTYAAGIMNLTSGYWANSFSTDSTFSITNSCLISDIGVVSTQFTNINGCDSIHTVTTTLSMSDSTFFNATSCLVADTGIVVQNLTNTNGCDSIHTNTTSFLLSDSTFSIATSCLVADTGIVVQNLTNTNGCDSIHTNTTSFLLSDSTFSTATSCLVADTGIVVQNLTNTNGCDSIHTNTTSFLLSDSTFSTATSCLVADTGIVVQNLTNTIGCDSIHTTTTVYSLFDSTFFMTASCLVADTGQVSTQFTNMNGCDSIYTIITSLLLSDSTFLATTSCLVVDTGIVVQNLININGCDSVHTTTITLAMSDSTFFTTTSCNPADTGILIQNLFNIYSCDSVVTTVTTLTTSSIIFLNVTSCNVADTGTTIKNLSNIYGCDSIVTINTTLKYPYALSNPLQDIEMCLDEVELIFADENGYNFMWSDGTQGKYLDPKESQLYTVTFIQDSTNCIISENINITLKDCIEECVVELPTSFSPFSTNSNNDNFKILTNCNSFEYFSFIITNRWGEIIFKTNNPSTGWDGFYKNTKQEIGLYIYNISFVKKDQTKRYSLQGNVTLIR